MYNLMICEDETLMLDMLRECIEWQQLGINVKALEKNGYDALNAFQINDIDIILADIKMPVISGIEMAQRIRHRNKRVRIIFLTSVEDFEYAKMAIDINASGYILKPFSNDELITVMKKAIEQLVSFDRKNDIDEAVEDNADADEFFIVSAVNRYINDNINRKIRISDISKNVGYSANYLGQLYKKNTGMLLSDYIIKMRMEYAAKLLEIEQNQINDIAFKLGYQDSAYFIRNFREYYGITPKAYRDKMLKNKR